MSTHTDPVTSSLEQYRSDFPALHQTHPNGSPVVYLDTGASAQKPQCVIDAVSRCYSEYYANAYRGVYYFGARIDEELENAREQVRNLLNAKSAHEIVFTAGTTMSINMVAQGWGRKALSAGDEIILNLLEHHANLVPWQMIAQETGAILKYLPLTADGQLDLDQLPNLLTNKTKLLAVTGMSNVLGTLPDLKSIISMCHGNNTLVLVDGAQLVPHTNVNVTELDIDFLTFSGHKMYGPSGVGVLYGKENLLDEMDPILGGGHMIDQVFQDHSTWAELPAKLEAGTLPIAPIIGLGNAIEYIQDIGLHQIETHERSLLEYAHDKLTELPGLQILGPSLDQKGAITSFTIEGLHPHDIADWLDRAGVAVRAGHHCTMPLHEHLNIHASTRASFGLYNNHSDIDALCEGLEYTLQKHKLI
ncbi:MAG: SufS family cysteine desulfurase [Planctomycetaceae bacterium]|jgi:cysteine desulfurase / selenocysteine lyase|nr:SufS family cysteine desulfurase [bacterium]MDC0273528.1 SufS family cysteine desulfurase [Planctomycetaceae bacterium]MDG2388345.1 SufS family cysteine desulfurase [Planctomycetaceae bacterium]